MTHRTTFVVMLSALLAVVAAPQLALAGPTSRSVRNEARSLESDIAKLLRDFKRLSPANRTKVLTTLSKLSDTDSDGVPDVLELTPRSRCDSDSDDDGLDDGDEYRNRTKPDDRDSDDDGIEDGDDSSSGGTPGSVEIEVKGRLVAKSSTEITVGTTVFVIGESTQYRQGAVTSGLTIDDFEVNACVEAEGIRSGGVNTAKKVKSDDDCL